MNDKELRVAEKVRKMNDREIAAVLDELRCCRSSELPINALASIVNCYFESKEHCRALEISFDNATEKDRERVWAYVYVAHVKEKIPQRVVDI